MQKFRQPTAGNINFNSKFTFPIIAIELGLYFGQRKFKKAGKGSRCGGRVVLGRTGLSTLWIKTQYRRVQ